MLVYFAMIAAWVDEKDTALQYLAANGQSVRRTHRCELRRIKAAPLLGPAARRSALRENR